MREQNKPNYCPNGCGKTVEAILVGINPNAWRIKCHKCGLDTVIEDK